MLTSPCIPGDSPVDLHECSTSVLDVVAVAAGRRDRQRDAVRFGDQMVLGARPGAAGRAQARLGHPSAPAHESCQSPLATSPANQRRSAPPATAHAAAATPPRRASPAAAASRSSPTRSPAPGARTPRGCRCRGQTRSQTSPCGHPAAYGQDDQPGAAPPATTARSALITRPGRPTVAADPSSRATPASR
jgi:hypothetical protein